MTRELAMALAAALMATVMEWRSLRRATAATRWLFGFVLLLSVGLYLYHARDQHVWRPSEWLQLFAPSSGPP